MGGRPKPEMAQILLLLLLATAFLAGRAGGDDVLEGFRISINSPPFNAHMRAPVRITYHLDRPYGSTPDELGSELPWPGHQPTALNDSP
jgi:hypothetical protein